MKASKRLAFTAGIGTSIAVIGSLAFAGFAYADDAPTTNQEVTSSESTQTPGDQPTKPTTAPLAHSGKDTTESPTATTDTRTPVTSDAPSQPTADPEASSNTERSGSSSPTPQAGGEAPVVVTSGPATSTDTNTSEPPATPETSEVWWLLPDGGTPDNVTWPQPLLDGPSVGCGQWAQVDTYNVNDIPVLTADLKLDYQEDWGVAISWRFVYGGDCPVIPPKPDDTTTIIDNHTTRSCPGDSVNGTSTDVVVYLIRHWIYDAPTNTWVAQEKTNPTGTTKEINDCKVNTPPTNSGSLPTQPSPATETTTGTSSPKTTASTLGTPGTTPNTVSSPPTERLAQTGTNDGMIIAFAVLLILAGIAFGTAAIISTRRKESK